MDKRAFKCNGLLAEEVMKGLRTQNMAGYHATSTEDALRAALEPIPAGSSAGIGGYTSAHETGFVGALEF